MSKTVTLSPFFDENVRLIAGVCSRCYNEHDDVRITAINSAFLRQTLPKSLKWVPPRSPHNLIEESLHANPWALLAATIFLNKTSCLCAKPSIDKFLHDFPDAQSVLDKHPQDLEVYFENIGLKKRAVQLWRMTHDYVHKPWRTAGELYGIGRYGEDAFRLFCLGDFSAEPRDRFLKIYKAWYLMKEKEERRLRVDKN